MLRPFIVSVRIRLLSTIRTYFNTVCLYINIIFYISPTQIVYLNSRLDTSIIGIVVFFVFSLVFDFFKIQNSVFLPKYK